MHVARRWANPSSRSSKPFRELRKKDERLYAYLALVDAIRLGNPREANLATSLLTDRLA